MRLGSYAYRMDEDTLYREAMTPDSQFASILSNAANKTLTTEYKAANTSIPVMDKERQ